MAIEDACSAASILLCTQADASELWGFSGDPETVLRRVARRFSRTRSDQTTVLTLGADGSAHILGDQYCTIPAYASPGRARFGSGDAFAAGYLYAYLTNLHSALNSESDEGTLLRFGNAAASLKRAIEGDIATITLDEVVTLVRNEERGRFR